MGGRGVKKKKKLTQEEQKLETANEFLNVKDIQGNFLYTKDNKIFAYLQIQSISLDLLSEREKKIKIKNLTLLNSFPSVDQLM